MLGLLIIFCLFYCNGYYFLVDYRQEIGIKTILHWSDYNYDYSYQDAKITFQHGNGKTCCLGCR